jgi:hypothetical protein
MNRMMSRIGAALFALTIIAAPALAQQPTASHLQVAREVVVASGISRTFDAIVPQILVQVQQVTVTRPELKGDLDEVIKKLTPEFDKKKEDMLAKASEIYATRLTEPELKDIAAFFNSPAGKKYVSTQPAILDEMFSAMKDWTQQLSAFVIDRVRTEMKARGKEF